MDDTPTSLLADSARRRRQFARRLVAWFRRAARDLPWRRTNDLYAIWVSEIMLQQTQVATVVPYYDRFLTRFPDIASLAAASEQDVLRLWEGLGYYRRARQMHAAARVVASELGGRFPTTYDAVRGLPGIGRYTAGAILSIGLDARLPILEANTIRVLSRLSAFRGEPASSAGQKHLWALAERLLPAGQCGAFNQALMELGSEICTPKAPSCERCPVAQYCSARAAGTCEQIPLPAKRTVYEDVREIAVVVRRAGRVLVRECQPGERWAGLWDFPRFAGSVERAADRVAALTGEIVELGPRLATLKHAVTRYRITLDCYEATSTGPTRTRGDTNPKRQRGRAQSNPTRKRGSCPIRWLFPQQLASLPLSTTGRKIASLIAK